MTYTYSYIKLTDGGFSDQKLYLDQFDDPDPFWISELEMTKNPNLNKWETSLDKMGKLRFELVSVTPHRVVTKSGMSGSSARIENIYIFKRKEEME